jgi:hypothetical protein
MRGYLILTASGDFFKASDALRGEAPADQKTLRQFTASAGGRT